MMLPDVNVLIYAHREEAIDHGAYRSWTENLINSDHAYALSDLVLSGFLRIVTHPRILNPPSSAKSAWSFVREIRDRPNCVGIQPGPRHWEIFARLCRESRSKGNRIPDAYLAALAIESGCEWITTDRDFSRFRGLRWRHPLHQTG